MGSVGAPESKKLETFGDINTAFNEVQFEWKQSKASSKLHEILDRHKPKQGWDVQVAVLFALGPLQGESGPHLRRRLLQVSAFLDINEHLASTSSQAFQANYTVDGVTSNLFAQAPTTCPMSEIDSDFLKYHGIHVIPSAVGETMLTLDRKALGLDPNGTLDSSVLSGGGSVYHQPQILINGSSEVGEQYGESHQRIELDEGEARLGGIWFAKEFSNASGDDSDAASPAVRAWEGNKEAVMAKLVHRTPDRVIFTTEKQA